MDKKVYKVAFVGGLVHPIPAIRGGAIQTLVTAIIDKNEKYDDLEIDVFTCKNKALNDLQYRNTRIFQIYKKTRIDSFFMLMYKVLRRMTGNILPYKNSFMRKVDSNISQRKYDAIIYETSDDEFIQVKRYYDEIIFFHIHSDYLNPNSYKIGEIVKNCDYFIAVSDFIKSRLELVSNDPDKVLVLKNAINVADYVKKENYSRNEIRDRFGINSDDVLFIYCGRLSPEKGCRELLLAIKDIPDCKLMIVGGENFDSNAQTAYVKELKAIAEEIGNRVFFTGYVEHDRISSYMHAADVAVVPSTCNEASSLTLLEFRASGLPSIATNIGGIKENCNSKTTILVEFDDLFVNNLSTAIRLLIDNKLLRENMQKASMCGINDFDYEHYYRNFYNLIDTTLKGDNDGNQSKK